MFRRCTARHILVLFALAAVLPCHALANDAAFAGPASDLVPLKNTRVQMRSEHIVLEQPKPNARWKAVAIYRFFNPRRKPVNLQVGFPEARCGPDEECAGPNGAGFLNLVTTVRGKAVKLRTGKVAANTEWAPRVGKVWLFDVTFQPREEVKIVHKYEFYAGLDPYGSSITYVTRTGALWKGKIGLALFTIRVPEKPWTVVYPRGYRLRSYGEKRVADRRFTELVFKQKKWRPKRDLTIHFGGEMLAPMAGKCPDQKMVIDAVKADTTTPGALQRVLTMRNTKDLRLCRNRVFARHGYVFSDKTLGRFFYGNKGLSVEARQQIPARRGDRIIGLKTDKTFTRARLTKREKAYIEALATEESRRN